jgi:peroxin-11B
LGKPIENLQAAFRATQTAGPLGEQLTAVARQVAYFLYLTYDAIVWANTINFITLSPDRARKANKTANRYWLSGITLSIINAAFKAQRIMAETSRLQHAAVDEKVSSAVDREAKLHGLQVCAEFSPTPGLQHLTVLLQHPSGDQATVYHRCAGLLAPGCCDRTRDPQ